MRHLPQTTQFVIFQSRTKLVIPEWNLVPEQEFHSDWMNSFSNDLCENEMLFGYHVNKYREIYADGMNSFQNESLLVSCE